MGINQEALFQEVCADLARVLDRQVPIESLQHLVFALNKEADKVPIQQTAIALDSSILLRLNKFPDVVDYLSQQHSGLFILPGQSIQEFWNNHLTVLPKASDKLGSALSNLKDEVKKVSSIPHEFESEIGNLIKNIADEFSHTLDPNGLKSVKGLLEVCLSKARVPYAPRSVFTSICSQRKRTKTPPGFLDDGDGDFFVWVDLLFGLVSAKKSGEIFNKVVFVTKDGKKDWSLGSLAHPILAAEVGKLLDVPFEIWTVERLKDCINNS